MWTQVEATDIQTYNHVKIVRFSPRGDDGQRYAYVLEARRYPDATGRTAWTLWLPERHAYTPPYETHPARCLSDVQTLQECRKLATAIILAAGCQERLEELRTAKPDNLPPWWAERDE